MRRQSGGWHEVAELPAESQVTLLRVLQEGEVHPIGANDAVKVDIRVVAATHQGIPTRRVDGRFHQDLYARLANRQRGFELGGDPPWFAAAAVPRVTPTSARLAYYG